MARITIVTIKNFIRDNKLNLWIKHSFSHNGSIDGIEYSEDKSFSPVEKADRSLDNNLGIAGAWFVLGSRDSFSEYKQNGFLGYDVYNSCGSFTIAKKWPSNINLKTTIKLTLDARPEYTRILTNQEKYMLNHGINPLPGIMYKAEDQMIRETEKAFPNAKAQDIKFCWITEIDRQTFALYQQYRNRWIYFLCPIKIEYVNS